MSIGYPNGTTRGAQKPMITVREVLGGWLLARLKKIFSFRRKWAVKWSYRQHVVERQFEILRPLIYDLKPNGWKWE